MLSHQEFLDECALGLAESKAKKAAPITVSPYLDKPHITYAEFMARSESTDAMARINARNRAKEAS